MHVKPRQPWLATWTPTLWLIALVTAGRLAYLGWWCPYTLVEDEANYWEWSRHLDLSYYTKGPGIAWAIAAATRAFGATAVAVRMVAVVSSAVAALGVAGLARDASSDKRAGFYAAAIFLLVPAFQFAAMLSTIDGPYVACTAAAAWAGWRVATRRSMMAWVVLGAALGVGTLFKYTMLLAIPGLVLFAVLARRDPKERGSRLGPVVAVLLFAVLVSPIVLWNVDEHWPTMRHLLGHLGVSGGDKPVSQGAGGWHYSPKWTSSFLGAQLAAGPMLILAWVQARRLWKDRERHPEAWRAGEYLLCLAGPILAFYLVVSFVATTQWNWTIAAYVPVCCLAGAAVHGEQFGRAKVREGLGVVVHAWRATVIVGLIVGLGALRLDLLARLPSVGRYVPVGRFTGADLMGAHVDRLVAEVKEKTGDKPFVMAQHYGRAAQLAFYMAGTPTVYCSSSLLSDGRLTPYDFWLGTDLRRAEHLVGRPAIVVGLTREDWAPLFDSVEEVGVLDGDGKKNRPAFRAYNFHGFPPGGLRSPGAPVFANP